jgi:hypothetical protein
MPIFHTHMQYEPMNKISASPYMSGTNMASLSSSPWKIDVAILIPIERFCMEVSIAMALKVKELRGALDKPNTIHERAEGEEHTVRHTEAMSLGSSSLVTYTCSGGVSLKALAIRLATSKPTMTGNMTPTYIFQSVAHNFESLSHARLTKADKRINAAPDSVAT